MFEIKNSQFPLLEINDNKIYYEDDKNNIVCIDINTGKQLWSYQNSNATYNITIENETIYFDSSKKMIALNSNTGIKKWEFETGDVIFSLPIVANGFIYFGSRDKKLYALNSDMVKKNGILQRKIMLNLIRL